MSVNYAIIDHLSGLHLSDTDKEVRICPNQLFIDSGMCVH